jgi:hypothetical protein
LQPGKTAIGDLAAQENTFGPAPNDPVIPYVTVVSDQSLEKVE